MIERLGSHLSDELVMFPQGGLQFRKNGFHFGLLGRGGLAAKLSYAFVKWGTCTTTNAQAFPGSKE